VAVEVLLEKRKEVLLAEAVVVLEGAETVLGVSLLSAVQHQPLGQQILEAVVVVVPMRLLEVLLGVQEWS
jgi:hypothetical protein